jgi:hypothetical protein
MPSLSLFARTFSLSPLVVPLQIIQILNAELANISQFYVSLPQRNAKSITIYVIFTVKGIEIADFCIILPT